MTSLSVSKLKNSHSQTDYVNMNFWACWPRVTSESTSDCFFSFYILLMCIQNWPRKNLPLIIYIPRHWEVSVRAIKLGTSVVIDLNSNAARVFTWFCSCDSIINISWSSDTIGFLLDISCASVPLMQSKIFNWSRSRNHDFSQNNTGSIICHACIFAHASQFAFDGL